MTQNSVVVIDGSNIATEGRSLPSLAQLDEAVRSFLEEYPHDQFIVVVDATFEHRIDPSERQVYDEALAANELLTPPAGTIGRGDAFILAIAEKAGATVFSNDSFQEFHGDFEWLFEEGRLIGGKPVPFIGWVFTARTPVRGQKSRQATRSAVRKRVRGGETASAKSASRAVPRRSATSPTANLPMPVPKSPPPGPVRSRRSESSDTGAEAPPERFGAPDRSRSEEADRPPRRGGRRRSGAASSLEPVNEGLAFVTFISEHAVGEDVEGEVTEFSSHGAYVSVGDARCYVPLSFLGDPPPRAARDVLERGETHTFVVQAIDGPRRAIDLALPGFERLDGVTDRAEGIDEDDEAPAARRSRLAADEPAVEPDDDAPVRRSRRRATAPPADAVAADELSDEPVDEPVGRRRTRTSPARAGAAVEPAPTVERDADAAGAVGDEDEQRVVRRRPRRAAPEAVDPVPSTPSEEEQEPPPRRRTRTAAPTATEPVAQGSGDSEEQEVPAVRRRNRARVTAAPSDAAATGAGPPEVAGRPDDVADEQPVEVAPVGGADAAEPAGRRRTRARRVADPVAAPAAAPAVVGEPTPRGRTRTRAAADPAAPVPAAQPVAEEAPTKRRARSRTAGTAGPSTEAAPTAVEPARSAPPRGRGRRVAAPDPGAPAAREDRTAPVSGSVDEAAAVTAPEAPAAKRAGARKATTKAAATAESPAKAPAKRAGAKRAAAVDDADGAAPARSDAAAPDPGAPAPAKRTPAKRTPAKRTAKKAAATTETVDAAPAKAAPAKATRKRAPARTTAPSPDDA